MITIKRIYEPAKEPDGFRLLVDRLWPRGLSKEDADIDLWMKEVAPSDKLRKWYGHEPQKWGEFKEKYFQELRDKSALIDEIKSMEKEKGQVTLLYAAKDEKHNNAAALQKYIG